MPGGFPPVGYGGGGGGVASVTGTAPVTSSGGANPDIGITPATDVAAGSLSAADKTKLDSIASGSNVTRVVFQPGGVAGGPIYTTAASIAALLLSEKGVLEVTLDDSIAPCVIPAGVTWNCQSRAIVSGYINPSLYSSPAQLEIQDGGQILDPGPLRYFNLLCDSQTTPSLAFSSSVGTGVLEFDNCDFTLSATATSPAVVGAAGAFIIATFVNSATSSLEPTLTVPLVRIGAGGAFGFYSETLLGGPSNISPQLFGGDASTVYIVQSDASGFPLPFFPLMAGPRVFTSMADQAAGVEYADTYNLEAGIAPPQVQNALDALAGTGIYGDGTNGAFVSLSCCVVGGSGNVANFTDFNVCAGGQGNTANGGGSGTLGGFGNLASGDESACAGGGANVASGVASTCLGGASNTASGDQSACVGGGGTVGNNATGVGAVCLGGSDDSGNTAAAIASVVMGRATSSFEGTDDGALVCGSGFGERASFGFTLSGAVPGAAPPEAVALSNGIASASIAFLANTGARLAVEAVAFGPNGSPIAEWDYRLIVNAPGGIAVIAASTDSGTYAPEIYSADAFAPLWTLVPSVDGTDNFVTFTFNNPTYAAGQVFVSCSVRTVR